MADKVTENLEAVVERLARALNRHYGPEISGRRTNWSHHTADDKEAYRVDARTLLDALYVADLEAVIAFKEANRA